MNTVALILLSISVYAIVRALNVSKDAEFQRANRKLVTALKGKFGF